jgi:hypothetical protein
MMEYWVVIRILSKFIFSTIVAINPILHYSRTHSSNIPAFQHSSRGEAPDTK